MFSELQFVSYCMAFLKFDNFSFLFLPSTEIKNHTLKILRFLP